MWYILTIKYLEAEEEQKMSVYTAMEMEYCPGYVLK